MSTTAPKPSTSMKVANYFLIAVVLLILAVFLCILIAVEDPGPSKPQPFGGLGILFGQIEFNFGANFERFFMIAFFALMASWAATVGGFISSIIAWSATKSVWPLIMIVLYLLYAGFTVLVFVGN